MNNNGLCMEVCISPLSVVELFTTIKGKDLVKVLRLCQHKNFTFNQNAQNTKNSCILHDGMVVHHINMCTSLS